MNFPYFFFTPRSFNYGIIINLIVIINANFLFESSLSDKDYPILSEIPKTDFSCLQKSEGNNN